MNATKNIIRGLSTLVLGATLLGLNANAFAGALHVVRIENRASQSIYNVYASPRNEPWGRDRLGPGGIVRPNDSVSLDLGDGSGSCEMDIKVVFRNGLERKQFNVDICEITTWHHNNSGDWFSFVSPH